MLITLIRHGEMDGDPFVCPEAGYVKGCLTEDIGVPQAEATAKALKDTHFDIVYSSPFGRALQTAQIVMAGRGLDIKIMPFIHEWMPYEQFRGLPDEQWEMLMKKHGDCYADETWQSELGEGYIDMFARIIPPFIRELKSLGIHSRFGGYVPEESVKDLSIAIFAHGGSLGVLLNFLLGARMFPLSNFTFEHTGVATVSFVKKKDVYYPQLIIPALHHIERK